jgi:hypothetical protein
MEKEISGLGPVEANSTGSQGSRRAVAPRGGGGGGGDDDDDDDVVPNTTLAPTPPQFAFRCYYYCRKLKSTAFVWPPTANFIMFVPR